MFACEDTPSYKKCGIAYSVWTDSDVPLFNESYSSFEGFSHVRANHYYWKSPSAK